MSQIQRSIHFPVSLSTMLGFSLVALDEFGLGDDPLWGQRHTCLFLYPEWTLFWMVRMQDYSLLNIPYSLLNIHGVHIQLWGRVENSCSVTQSCPILLCPHGLQHDWLPCLSPFFRADSDSCPLSWWCHPIISSSVNPFSSCLQSFQASGSFPVSWLFTSGG